jgi:hypothetical protein
MSAGRVRLGNNRLWRIIGGAAPKSSLPTNSDSGVVGGTRSIRRSGLTRDFTNRTDCCNRAALRARGARTTVQAVGACSWRDSR